MNYLRPKVKAYASRKKRSNFSLLRSLVSASFNISEKLADINFIFIFPEVCACVELESMLNGIELSSTDFFSSQPAATSTLVVVLSKLMK